jgi:hypothetical protein
MIAVSLIPPSACLAAPRIQKRFRNDTADKGAAKRFLFRASRQYSLPFAKGQIIFVSPNQNRF